MIYQSIRNCTSITPRVNNLISKTSGLRFYNSADLSCLMPEFKKKVNVIFVLGPPGSGKGTQCEKIVQQFGYKHLSAGELLRTEQNAKNSQFGELIHKHMVNGTIVPVAITCSLLLRAMNDSKCENFLIDGFPRNQDNLDGWIKEVDPELVKIQSVLFFECSPNNCLIRCIKRGENGSGRSDDDEEVLKKRFITYKNSTLPIVEYYRKLGLLIEIDANKTVDDMYTQLISNCTFFKQ